MAKESLFRTTKDGIKHGLINSLANSISANLEKKIDSSKKEEYEKKKKSDSEIVKARYINYIGNEERLETAYMRYAGQPITQWRFLNNEVYSVPRGLVEQVNNSHKNVKKRTGLVNKDGLPIDKEENSEKTHEFVGII